MNKLIRHEEEEQLKQDKQNSYISKEEFLKMLENISFVAINKCYIEFITSFIYKSEDKTIKPLLKTIDIN